jgi:signal transduction histidine kinase/ActR/RegA family two-component response regulator
LFDKAVPTLAEPGPAHFVQFYEDDEFIADEVAEFLDGALRAGDTAILIATPLHRAQVAERLRGLGSATAARNWYPGELVSLDARETLARFMVDGEPNEALFLATVGSAVARAAGGGTRSVRAFGEMVALLCADGNAEAAIRLEDMWNALGRRHAFSLMCAYPMNLFSSAEHAETFRHVCATHSTVRPSERLDAAGDAQGLPMTIASLQQKTLALQTEVARRTAVEQTLRRREKELAAASQAKDEFLAMLGHELRNPLSPIVTALQLMKMRGDIKSSKEQAVIQRQVDHLIRLVDDLLDVSRITQGKVELRCESVEIAQVLAKAVEMASLLLEQRRHQLTIAVPSSGLLWRGDSTRLAQVVANLLTNAARYTEPGGHVFLSAVRESDQIVIRVKDTGKGLGKEMLTNVFQLFFQGHQGIDRAEGGLGIGLALVRNLVELHGGTVQADSDGPGRGSEFTVRLPIALATDPQVARPESSGADHSGATRRRILVVDDNADAADLLGMLLSAGGHHVRIAHDPVGALAIAAGFDPDIALLDIGLPVMDGYELGLQLRERTRPGCRLIALTGYGQESDRKRSEEAGFDSHLVKPIDSEQLLQLVNSLPAGALQRA